MERAVWFDWQRWARAFAFMVGLIMALVSPVLSADYQIDRIHLASLAGLTGVYVVVEKMDPDAERLGLAQSTLRTDVELKLRQAGIRILTKDETFAAPGTPLLYLEVNIIKNQLGLFSYCLHLELVQEVKLTRNPAIVSRGATWQGRGLVGTAGAEYLYRVRDNVRDAADEFINAYLAANPKR